MTTFLKRLLRRTGLRATDRELADAATENAVRDNDKAFEQITQAARSVPEVNERLKGTLERISSPFGDLEDLMQQQQKRGRNHQTPSPTRRG